MTLAPIALFVYRRPEHTRRTLAALSADPLASTSDLVVFADGAKKAEHADGVRAVRDLVADIKGFRSVNVIARDRNFGLANSIADGVTQLCRERGRVIVVEDDLVVAPQFLGFLNRGLDVYANEQHAYQISGYMYPGDYGNDVDGLFLPMISCWGWATWDRAWQHYDASLAGFEDVAGDPNLKTKFNLNGAYDYFTMAQQQKRGDIDSWGICWHLSVFMRGGLVLYPRRTLVQNLGFDASGTHGRGNEGLHSELWLDAPVANQLRLPAVVEIDVPGMAKVQSLLHRQNAGYAAKIVNSLRGFLKT